MRLFTMNRDICEVWAALPARAFEYTSEGLSEVARKWFFTFAEALVDQAPRRGVRLSDNYDWFVSSEATYEERKTLIEKYARGCENMAATIKMTNEVSIVDSTEDENGEKQQGVISAAVLGSYDKNYEDIDASVAMMQATKRYEEWSETIEILNEKNLSFLIAIVYVGIESGVEKLKNEAVQTLSELFAEYKGQDLEEVIKDIVTAPNGLDYIMSKANLAY